MIGSFAWETLFGFIAGAAAGSFRIPAWGVLAAAFTVALFLKNRTFLARCFAAGALCVGFAYYMFYSHAAVAFTRLPEVGKTATFQGVVVTEPQFSDRTARFSVSLSEPYRGTVLVIASPRNIEYGDGVALRGRLVREEKASIIWYPTVEITDHHKGSWLKERLLAVKYAVMRGFERALPPDNAALLSGITLGARSTFSNELKNAMATSGTLHIVAVSGYNISVLALNIAAVATFFFARRAALWIAVAAILLFVGMVGTEASVVRAAIMGIIALLAEGTGRPSDQAYAIAVAAALMVAWDPMVIREDIGFALSFLSLLGVVYMSPAFRSIWRKASDRGFLRWKENLDTTVGAQLGVLPVLLISFGGISLTSVFANILILPLVPFTMGAGFLLGAANAVSPLLGFPIAEAARLLTAYEIGVMHIFSRYAIPVGNFLFFPAAVAAYYALLIAFIVSRTRAVNESGSIMP